MGAIAENEIRLFSGSLRAKFVYPTGQATEHPTKSALINPHVRPKTVVSVFGTFHVLRRDFFRKKKVHCPDKVRKARCLYQFSAKIGSPCGKLAPERLDTDFQTRL